jgi:hypothetical protein
LIFTKQAIHFGIGTGFSTRLIRRARKKQHRAKWGKKDQFFHVGGFSQK